MNENIDLTQILKDSPKGTKLYSTALGEVTFLRIESNINDEMYGITVEKYNGYCHTFYKDGRLARCYQDAECTLFPSRDNRDWSTFKAPKPHQHFEPFQRVLVFTCGEWTTDLYSHYDKMIKQHIVVGAHPILESNILPYKDNEHLLGKKKQNEPVK